MAKTEKLDFSELNEELGGLGKFQLYVCFLGCLATFMPGMAVVNIIFVGNIQPHRCVIPQCEFVGNSSYKEDFLNFTTPAAGDSWDKCHRFKTIDTRDMSCDPINFNPHLKKNCSQYIYDTSVLKSTTVSEFNLVCENGWMQPLAYSCYMVGMLIGAFVLGDLADRIGRKRGLLVALFITSTGGIIGSCSYNYFMFLIARIITGCGGVANFAIAYINVVEFTPVKYRKLTSVIVSAGFAMGEAFVAVLAYNITEWRWLQLSCSIPPMIMMVYYWLLPESIRWSISQGRIEEAKKTIRRVEKINNVKVSQKTWDLLDSNENIELEPNNQSQQQPKENHRNPLDLLHYPNIRKRTFSLMFCWVTTTMCYYGLNLNAAKFVDNIYVNFVIVMLIEIPGLTLSYATVDSMGRKWALTLVYIISGSGCLISGLIHSDYITPIAVFSLFGKLGASASFSLLFIYTSEIFPTSMRSLGIGTCSTTARLGGIVAPFVAELSKIFSPLPMLIFGSAGIISATIMIFLPETLGCELPQTLQQSESFGVNQPFLYFACCGSKTKKKQDHSVNSNVNEAFSEN